MWRFLPLCCPGQCLMSHLELLIQMAKPSSLQWGLGKSRHPGDPQISHCHRPAVCFVLKQSDLGRTMYTEAQLFSLPCFPAAEGKSLAACVHEGLREQRCFRMELRGAERSRVSHPTPCSRQEWTFLPGVSPGPGLPGSVGTQFICTPEATQLCFSKYCLPWTHP